MATTYPTNVKVTDMELTPCIVSFKQQPEIQTTTGPTVNASPTFTMANHGYSVGKALCILANAPTGFTVSPTIYYVVAATTNTFELSATVNGSAINATSVVSNTQFAQAESQVFTSLGGTLGNVKVKLKYDLADIKADQFGTTVLDKRVSGFLATVETELTQIKDMSQLALLFPHATLLGGPGAYALDWDTNVGDSAVLKAGQLKLHPQSAASNDESHDWLFYVAAATADSEITYSPTEQTKAKIVWQVYPDLTVEPARFCKYGDPDIV